MEYTLKAKTDSYAITVEFSAESISDVMENIKLFLLGTGFHPETIDDH